LYVDASFLRYDALKIRTCHAGVAPVLALVKIPVYTASCTTRRDFIITTAVTSNVARKCLLKNVGD